MFRIDESAMNTIAKEDDRVYMLSIFNGTDKTLIHHGTYDIIGNNTIKVIKKIVTEIRDTGVTTKVVDRTLNQPAGSSRANLPGGLGAVNAEGPR